MRYVQQEEVHIKLLPIPLKRSSGIERLSSSDKSVSNKRFVSDAFLSASTILFKILPLSIHPAFHTSATSLNFKFQEYLRLAIFSS